jgi:hypothetical protein
MHLPLEEAALRAGRKVLMEVDGNGTLTVGDPPGILGGQLRPHPIHTLNIIITIIKLITY